MTYPTNDTYYLESTYDNHIEYAHESTYTELDEDNLD